jgi:predicted permease
MRRLRALWWRIRGLFRRRQLDSEFAAEMESHLQLHIDENLRVGMTPEEARRAAILKLGGVEQTKAIVRERRGLPLLENLVQDVRYGGRVLRAFPGFTTVAILTLALGIGANAAIFSVVDAILLRPLPYPEPNRLVRVWESAPSKGYFRNVVNPINFLDWREHSRSFESMAAILDLMTNLSSNGQPVAVHGLQVSSPFFSILRIPPFLGRTFTEEDGVAGHHQVVILSYELWQRQFGANPQIIGQKLGVDAVPYVVIGVMPRGFSFPKTRSEVWTPLPLARTEEWEGGRYLTVVARLKPGVTLEQARQDMRGVAELAAEARPHFDEGWSAEVIPMLEDATEGVRRPLWILLAAVGFLLLIACANVANLLLMRGAGRRREMAVRSALGAARARILQQLFVESLLLSLAGTAAGLLFAQLGLRTLLALIPPNAPLPRSEAIVIDSRVLLLTFLVALSTALIFGSVPALRLSRVDLQQALKHGSLPGGVGGHQTLRRCFVVAEVALALLLSVGAGLMLRSFSRLISVDPGFSPERLLTMHIWTSPARYHDDLKRSQYFDRILTELRSAPGVRAAGSTHFLPLTEKISGSCFSPSDLPAPTPAESPSAQFLIISSDYFRTMGTPIMAGREFDARDNFNSQPVAIVNHAFAERYFPDQNIFEKRLSVCWTIEKPVAIVGVVADARQAQLQQVPTPTIFLSNSQAPMYFATFVVRATGDPRQIARSAEAAVHRVDPDQAVSDIQSMETVLSDSVSSPRFQAILLVVFAGLAIVLAMIGVYGIVSYSVSQRTNEIGIRVALGARSADIVRLVFGEALTLAGIALGLGLAASLALSRVLETLLFEVTATDPITLASVCCLVLVVSAVAALWPARRAMLVDPMVALRHE